MPKAKKPSPTPQTPASMGSLTETLKKSGIDLKKMKPRGVSNPVWKGPYEDGVTYSLLCKFLVCRERFRLLVVEGWKPADKFSPLIEFGSLWHAAEEAYAANLEWRIGLRSYALSLLNRYPMQREEIEHWYSFASEMFPIYTEHWEQHPDVQDRTPVYQEHVFDVPYLLPSGRGVRLRGKWDSVDIIGKGKDSAIYIQENKTKSQIDEVKIGRQVAYDLQSMMYSLAWTNRDRSKEKTKLPKFGGVRYNVIRRSSHKSTTSLLKKIAEDQEDGRIGEWFARWKVDITAGDIDRFCRETFDPILEQLCEWWEAIKFCEGKPFAAQYNCIDNHGLHFRMPYGIYNPLLEGGSGDLDALLNDGSTVGLRQVDDLFPELKESK